MVNRDEIYVVYESIHISVADASQVVIDTILKVYIGKDSIVTFAVAFE